jgi:hypothetical protein
LRWAKQSVVEQVGQLQNANDRQTISMKPLQDLGVQLAERHAPQRELFGVFGFGRAFAV